MNSFPQLLIVLLSTIFVELSTAQTNPVCSNLPNLSGLYGNNSCCTFPTILEKKSMEECWNEQKSLNVSDPAKHCKALECFFKKNNALKSDLSLDKDATETYLNNQLKDNVEWLKLVKQIAVDQCLVNIEKDYTKMMDFFKTNNMELPEPGTCSMKPMLMSICVMAKGFAHCPENHWNKGSTCDEWKKYLENCTNNIENTLEFYKQLDKAQ